MGGASAVSIGIRMDNFIALFAAKAAHEALIKKVKQRFKILTTAFSTATLERKNVASGLL
ncbi:hypothetical protein EGK14_11985 [Erwinia sp. 198]|nr:hypothetical protein EGK14_11985 [Erwinia sp. 198]